MAGRTITASQNPSDLFHRYVLTNLLYWRDYVVTQQMDTAALDCGRDRIIRALSFAFELYEAWPITRELIEAFSSYMERRGYWEVWNWTLTQAIAAADRSNDLAGKVVLSAMLARLLLRQSQLKQTIYYHRRTIHLARRIGDHYNEARACSNLGYLYIEKGYWHRAEILCCQALIIFDQLGSQHGQAHTENHLGILYTRQGQWDKARTHLERACVIWQALSDDYGLMYGYNNLGMLLVEMSRPDEALVWLYKAFAQAQLVGEEAIMGTIYLNMGISHRLRGEFTEAEAYYWRAKTIFQRFSNSRGLAETGDNLGLVCLDQKKWTEAKEHLETALQVWRSLNEKYNEVRAITYLIEYEWARGNQEQACNWLNEAEQMLSQYDHAQRYHQLHAKLAKFRRSLTESNRYRQAAAK